MFNIPSVTDIFKTFLGLSLLGIFVSIYLPDKNMQLEKQYHDDYWKRTELLDQQFDETVKDIIMYSREMDSLNNALSTNPRYKTDKAALESHHFLFNTVYRLSTTKTSKSKELDIKQKLERAIYERQIASLKLQDAFMSYLFWSSIICMLICLWGMSIRENWTDIILRKEAHSKVYYSCCQSCGRRFNSMIQPPSIDGNREKVIAYCSSCHDGVYFLNLSLTPTMVYESALLTLKPKSKFRKRIIEAKIHGLERWAQIKYF